MSENLYSVYETNRRTEIRVPVNECEKCWLDWLKQEAKEGE